MHELDATRVLILAVSWLVFATGAWWCGSRLRRYAARAEQRAAMRLSKERMAAGKQAAQLRTWRAKWTPERWGMPTVALSELDAILGSDPSETPQRDKPPHQPAP